ncbi:MAG: L-rhamnose mutarotase [Prevotellaceae bacterium]|nr:L-rhamnose mutarotase [Prevotellaceae bacterium]
METKEGYKQQDYGMETKRYCQTLDLRNDPQLIETYKKLHSQEHVWKEIIKGIREVGILEMEIYILGTRLFMIVETPLDFDWDSAMARLAELPKQSEWEALTAKYQVADANAASSEKWKLMERIFHLYKF